jgi:chromosome segregation ATPase
MSLKARQQPETELDHVRDTLTDLVGVVGETRQDVKAINNKVDEIKQHLSEQDKRFNQQDKRFDQQDKRFDQLELLIRQLLPNTSN